jgi:hypothetical protein
VMLVAKELRSAASRAGRFALLLGIHGGSIGQQRPTEGWLVARVARRSSAHPYGSPTRSLLRASRRGCLAHGHAPGRRPAGASQGCDPASEVLQCRPKSARTQRSNCFAIAEPSVLASKRCCSPPGCATREWLIHTVLERVGTGTPPCNWEQALRSLAAVCGGQAAEVEAGILRAAAKG